MGKKEILKRLGNSSIFTAEVGIWEEAIYIRPKHNRSISGIDIPFIMELADGRTWSIQKDCTIRI